MIWVGMMWYDVKWNDMIWCKLFDMIYNYIMYNLWYVIVVRKILMWSHNVTRHYIVKKQLDRVPGINHCKSCRKVADLRITCMSRWVLWSPTTILEDFSECVRHQKQLKFDHVLFMYPCKARCQPDLQNLAEKRLHFFVPCVGLCPKKKEGGKGTKLDPLMNCESSSKSCKESLPHRVFASGVEV